MGYQGIRRTVIATAVAIASGTAAANDRDESSIIEPIDTVTIIGTQTGLADVAGSAHVIDAETLAIFNDADILRVLRTVPGVYLQEEEGFGLRPNIGIRGSGLDRSSRIALLEDGVLIAPAPYASPSAYYFPTQRRMDAIEVLKGPSSITVGSRTVGGALNLVSTPIPDEFGGMLDFRAGQHGTFDAHVHAGDRGERLSWLVETVQSQSDGYKHIDGPIGGDTGFDIEDYVVKLQLDSDPAADTYQSLRLKAGYTEQHSDETYLGLTDADFAMDPEMRYAASEGDVFDSEHEQVQLTYVIDPGGSWSGEITAYRNNFQRNWYKLQSVDGSGISGVLADPDGNATALSYLRGATSPDDAISKRANNREYYSQGLQGQVDRDLSFGDTEMTLTAGFRFHKDEEDRLQFEDSYRMEDGELVLTSAGAPGSQANRVSDADVQSYFIATEIRAGDWILTPGIRHESIDLRRLDFSTSDPNRSEGPTRVRENSISVTIPGMGALYKLNDNWRLLGGVHKGFNPPGPGSSADEESSLNIEGGVRYDNGRLAFESVYFVNDYDNLVGTVTNSTGGGGEIGDQFDGGEATVSGLELTADYGWALNGYSVPLSLQYTWTTEYEFENGFESSFDPWGDVVSGDELPYIPEHQLRASAGLEAERWRLNLGASYRGEMRTVAGQGPIAASDSIESHVVWDVMAAWNFSDSFSTYFKVDNLTDEVYAAARRPAGLRPGLPRTAYLGLTYRL